MFQKRDAVLVLQTDPQRFPGTGIVWQIFRVVFKHMEKKPLKLQSLAPVGADVAFAACILSKKVCFPRLLVHCFAGQNM